MSSSPIPSPPPDASGTARGLVNTATQTVAGNKTFSGSITASNLVGSNNGDVTIGTFGSTPSAAGASLSGQIITFQPADSLHPGSITAAAQSLGGLKTLLDGLSVDTTLSRVPHTQVISAVGNTIAVTGARLHLSGATDFILTSTPTVAAGTVVGQEVQIVGRN